VQALRGCVQRVRLFPLDQSTGCAFMIIPCCDLAVLTWVSSTSMRSATARVKSLPDCARHMGIAPSPMGPDGRFFALAPGRFAMGKQNLRIVANAMPPRDSNNYNGDDDDDDGDDEEDRRDSSRF
jgi:hypothetical protein